MKDPEVDASSCSICARPEDRALVRGEHAEAWAVLDELRPTSRSELQLQFVLAGLLALLEAAPSTLALLSYREIAVQVGRAEQSVWRDVQKVAAAGWVQIVERGIGEHTRAEDEDFRKAVWDVGEVGRSTSVGRERVRQRRDERRAAEQAAFDAIARDGDQDWDRFDEPGEVDEGSIGGKPSEAVLDWLGEGVDVVAGEADSDAMPWLDDMRWDGNPGCHERGVPLERSSSGVVSVPLKPERKKEEETTSKENPSVRDSQSYRCPPAAMSPVDYLTWSAAFQETNAGVFGWALARRQVRQWVCLRPLTFRDCLGPITAADAGRITGLSRQGARKALHRLVDGGYAVREEDGRFRLLFHVHYGTGQLHDESVADRLAARYQDDLAERSERQPWTIEAPPPGSSSRFGRFVSSASHDAKVKLTVAQALAALPALYAELYGDGERSLQNFDDAPPR